MLKESVMLCIGTLTPEHWAFVPLILDILHNPIVLFRFVPYFFISFSYWEGCDVLRDM